VLHDLKVREVRDRVGGIDDRAADGDEGEARGAGSAAIPLAVTEVYDRV
jgi:hypothetical protein